MPKQRRYAERQFALFLLGVVLLVPPVLVIFNRADQIAGIPTLYMYLFAAWTLLIGLAAFTMYKLDDGERPAEGRPPAMQATKPPGGEHPPNA